MLPEVKIAKAKPEEESRVFKVPTLKDIFQAMSQDSKNDFTEEDRLLVKKTYAFAKIAHQNQFRKSGEDYFSHVVYTAINIARQNMDIETIVAGLLHDTLEDTGTTAEEIEKEFGNDVLFLVQGVTKLGVIKYQGMERHVESMRKFFIAMAEDIRVVVIKLCDRLHNVSTLNYLRADKAKRIAIETLEIHARLADRIGMGKLKAELEDYAFPYAYPEDYQKVEGIFEENRSSSEEYLLKTLKKIKEELKIFEINFIQIDHRLKHLYSLYEKLKKHDWDIQKIYDIAAMRIIVSDMATCYQVLGVIHGLYKPVPGRFKDYIAVPKPNGYQSLHTTVFDGEGGTFEVQIRTLKMHEEAEYGIASHLFYKEIGDSKKSKNLQQKAQAKNLAEKIAWTKDLVTIQKDLKNNEFIRDIKESFLNKKIFIHTPRGDIVEMPSGSGVIDFAYNIHSDIGNHISSVMVNGKIVSLSTRLHDRDIVEIMTRNEAKPSRKWLEYAYTNLAKRHIRNFLKEFGGPLDRFFVK